jgi:hypothetical protein
MMKGLGTSSAVEIQTLFVCKYSEIASSSFLKRMTERTGPNTSLRAILLSLLTLVNNVLRLGRHRSDLRCRIKRIAMSGFQRSVGIVVVAARKPAPMAGR